MIFKITLIYDIQKFIKNILFLFGFLMMPFFLITNSYGENTPEKKEYVLALAPQHSLGLMLKAWTPVLWAYNEQTNNEIYLKVFPSKAAFEENMLSGESDFVFGSAFYYLILNQKHGYIPLVRSNKKFLNGIIVVKKNSDITTVDDLNGQRVAFPSQNAFGASLYIRSMLDSKGIKVEPLYSENHEKTYFSVDRGLAIAGGGVLRTFNVFNLRNSLKVIYTSPDLPTHPLMAHPRVPKKVQKDIISFLLSLNETDDGRRMLTEIKLEKPVRVNHRLDYQSLRDLNILDFSSFDMTGE